MPRLSPETDHLLRRAAFGASAQDAEDFRKLSVSALVSYLVDYEGRPDDVDARIGRPDHAQVSRDNLFAPDVDINDARERWLFRLIHTRRPLQEKMVLFWHNHFATAYSKLAADSGEVQATKMLAHKPGVLRGPQGQIELFRQFALGNFRELLLRVAQDPAMLVWLDGQSNVKARPQENFGREVMELFTIGVDHYAESDVYAAARVFTGWNLRRSERFESDDPNAYLEFLYDADEHDTDAKTFTFPVSSSGGRTIPARSASSGFQDGVDLISALATHPETARRLMRKFWQFFVSEIAEPDPAFVERMAGVYLANGTEIRPVIRAILTSPWFTDAAAQHARYSWPPEFVARAIREVGWQNLSLEPLPAALANMGMGLFEPPTVGGWPTGSAWFSTATMLSRTNTASLIAASQKEFLAVDLQSRGRTREDLLAAMTERVTVAPLDAVPQRALEAYLAAAGAWTGSSAQVATRASGLARLLVGSAEFQFV